MGQQHFLGMWDVPSLKRNLIFPGMLDSIGCEYKSSAGRFEILKDSKVVLVGLKISGVFLIKEVSMNNVALIVYDDMLTERDLWHRILSHISGKSLKMLSEQGSFLNEWLTSFLSVSIL